MIKKQLSKKGENNNIGTAQRRGRIAVVVKAGRKSQKRLTVQPVLRAAASEFPCYYWTHGPSKTHNGIDCKDKAQDHQDQATFKTKMGDRLEPWYLTKKEGQNLIGAGELRCHKNY